jgi:hypothetical protein
MGTLLGGTKQQILQSNNFTLLDIRRTAPKKTKYFCISILFFTCSVHTSFFITSFNLNIGITKILPPFFKKVHCQERGLKCAKLNF